MNRIEEIRRRYADLSPTDPRFRAAMELANRDANGLPPLSVTGVTELPSAFEVDSEGNQEIAT